jgi:hypothetical protein
MAEVKFLFDNQLIAEVERLIKEAKRRLLLVSPFIDLDARIQDALSEKIGLHDFELKVLFGKNEDNCFKSIKKNSLEFLKRFPNVEIRYNERLHAKFYQNDYDYIMTSLNLYDYSLANNIEVGIIGNYAYKGLLGKVINSPDALIADGVEKVRQDVFGLDKEVDPLEKFSSIYNSSELKYKTSPVLEDHGGIKGVFGAKKLKEIKVETDHLIQKSETKVALANTENSAKTYSASQLSKSLGVPQTKFVELMQEVGLIADNKITTLGSSKGLVMKSYMGKEYISYPDNLLEFDVLRKAR